MENYAFPATNRMLVKTMLLLARQDLLEEVGMTELKPWRGRRTILYSAKEKHPILSVSDAAAYFPKWLTG